MLSTETHMPGPFAIAASFVLAVFGCSATLVAAAALNAFLVQGEASALVGVAALFFVLGVGGFAACAAVLKFSARTWLRRIA